MYLLKGFLDFLTILFRRPKFLVMIATLILTVITVMSVYGVGVVSDVPVYVVDHDNSTVSRTIRLYLDAGPDLKVLGTLDTLEEAQDALNNGDAAAVVYIPNGLSQALKTQSGGHVFAYIDGTNMILAKTADKAIQTVVKSTSVGVSMIAVNKKGLPKQELMGALQPINLDVDRPFNALTLYSEYLLPVLIFFCLNIFICLMTCACYQEPLPAPIQSHVIRKRFFYFGRLAAVFLFSLLGGMWIYQYGLPRVDIVLQSMPLMALTALLAYILLTQAMFAIINLATPKPIAMSLSYLTCMLSVMFSGLTWPIEMMPWYLQEFTTWIPLTPFLQSVQVFLYHDANWGDLAAFYQMFLKQAVLFTIAIFVLMRLRDFKYFSKWCWKKLHASPVLEAPVEDKP
ncbi:MAG: ABC transporter permease [Proteobacteria bacterium]|nr:ABC transporter permease [Pseudomonadota bacterium]